MRRVIFIAPVESVSGKWAQVDRTTYDNDQTYGRRDMDVTLFISHRRTRDYAKGTAGIVNYYGIRTNSNFHLISAREQAARDNFRTLTAAVRTAYATPELLRNYTTQWKASGVRETLRQFIWKAEAEKLAQNP